MKVARSLQAWIEALHDEIEDSNDEIGELKVFLEQGDESGVLLDALVMQSHVIAMVSDETRNATEGTVIDEITGIIGDSIIYVIQVWCTTAEEGMKVEIF